MGFKDVFNDIPVVGSLFGRTEDAISNEVFREAEIDDQLQRSEPILRLNQQILQENMAYQNDLAKEMFDYEADYNTPLHQRQRNAAAGLNENWVDGTGVIQGGLGSTPSMPSAGDISSDSKLQRQLQREQLSNARRQTDLNQDMQKKQIELIEEQKSTEKSKQRLNDQEADWYNTDAAGKEIDNWYKAPYANANISNIKANTEKLNNDKKWQDLLGDQQIKESNERIDKMIIEEGNIEAATRQINELLPLIKEKTDAETAELFARSKMEQMQGEAAALNAKSMQIKVGLDAQMIAEIKRHNVAQERLQDYIYKSQNGVNTALAKLYKSQGTLVDKNALMAEIQYQIMHYGKANGIPQTLMELQIDFAREQLYHETEKRQMTRNEADNVAMQTILLPFNAVGNWSNSAFSNYNAMQGNNLGKMRYELDWNKWQNEMNGYSTNSETYDADGNLTGSRFERRTPNRNYP